MGKVVNRTKARGGRSGRPAAALRLLFKLPVAMHRLGLRGWERLVGARWMLITTTGRKTGKPHRVMVDVIGRNESSDTYYVAAAYGSNADWVRNVRAHSSVRAQVGPRDFAATVTPLSSFSTEALLTEFMRRNPMYARMAMVLAGLKFRDQDDLRRQLRGWLVFAVGPDRPPDA